MKYFNMHRVLWVTVVGTVFLAGCTSLPDEYRVNPDRMQTNAREWAADDEPVLTDSDTESSQFSRITTLDAERLGLQERANLALQFVDDDQVQVTVNDLPVREFIQTVFREQLNVNYIIADNVGSNQTVTLNVAEPISSRRLFRLVDQVLAERDISISERDGIMYVYSSEGERGESISIGLGRTAADVPDTSRQVLQVVPLRFGITTSLERTLNGLSQGRLTFDQQQNAIFVRGSRTEVLRVLDLVSILDVPATRGQFIGLQELTYITPDEYIVQLSDLLEAEGILAGPAGTRGAALLMIKIEQIGAVALFAGDEFVLDRAEFWAGQVDRPTKGADRRYYIYHPRYARAQDLGRSVAPMIGGSLPSEEGRGDATRNTQTAQQTTTDSQGLPRQDNSRSENTQQQAVTASGDGIRLTVDERSNSLIFYTTGEAYQSLLPIIRRLDVMPKQVLIDATIAEVTMSDEFSQGFEFAFRSGRLQGGTRNSLGVSEMSGFRLDWTDGVSTILARLSENNSLVNVLSNPTLVVRDGVSAQINVGNDIPTIGATITNPNFDTQTTNIVYRRTGVRLNVTPTVNARGLVVMQIDQQISNTSTTGPSLAGSPSIFERNISTEVIAQSGQTVLLGGLISENQSQSDSQVPGLASIPLFGHLFRGRSQESEKTELVIFITPRVIESTGDWENVRNTLSQGLKTIRLNEIMVSDDVG